MPHKFKITAARNGQFKAKFVYNAEIMVWSENYTARASAQNCIESIKKNAPAAPTVDLDQGRGRQGLPLRDRGLQGWPDLRPLCCRQWRDHGALRNLQAKASAKNCIDSVKKNGPGAAVVDESYTEEAGPVLSSIPIGRYSSLRALLNKTVRASVQGDCRP